MSELKYHYLTNICKIYSNKHTTKKHLAILESNVRLCHRKLDINSLFSMTESQSRRVVLADKHLLLAFYQLPVQSVIVRMFFLSSLYTSAVSH